jgi:hypothetical protein
MDITNHKQLDESILEILDSEELTNISGGGMILANTAVTEYVAGVMQSVSHGWSSFVRGFNEGYEKNRK